MKATKGFLTASIALIFILVMMAGCGGNEDNASLSDSTNQPLHNNQAGNNPVTSNPAETAPSGDSQDNAYGDFVFSVENGEVTITGYTGNATDLTIPDVINGLPVTTIGRGAFAHNATLVNLHIPDSITHIGNEAFSATPSLTNVHIGTGVTHIGLHAFGSSGLTSLVIPDNVTHIGFGAFQMDSLTDVHIGTGVIYIGNHAFGGSSLGRPSIQRLEVPANVEHIDVTTMHVGEVVFVDLTAVADNQTTAAQQNQQDNNQQQAQTLIPVSSRRFATSLEYNDGLIWVLPWQGGTNTINAGEHRGIWTTEPGAWQLVDRDGNIWLETNIDESPASVFGNGAGLIRRADDTVEMIDIFGNVISSPLAGEYQDILAFVPELGMAIVTISIGSAQGNVGVINSDGDWQVADVNTGWFFQGGATVIRVDYVAVGVVFVFRMAGGTPIYESFNLFTGELIRIQQARFPSRDAFSRDGYAVFSNGNIFLADIHVNVHEVMNPRELGLSTFGNILYRDGLFFLMDGRFTVGGFWDRYGNLVIDLSDLGDYSVARTAHFVDGNSLLLLENAQGDTYYTVINTAGEFLFQPRERIGRNIRIEHGFIVVDEMIIKNFQGEVVLDLNNLQSVDSSRFYNGVIRVWMRGTPVHFFIDMHGNGVF